MTLSGHIFLCPLLCLPHLQLHHVETAFAVRRPKLSNIDTGKYLDEKPLGNTRFGKLGLEGVIMELIIGETSYNPT